MKEISLHILDLIENSAAAGASRVEIVLAEDPSTDRLRVTVRDDGRGMPAELARAARDPFTTTRSTRKVGLGLALLAAAAEQAGGSFSLKSRSGTGTQVTACFQLSHLDRAPLGKLDETLAAAALIHPEIELRLRHRVGRRHYRVGSHGFGGKLPKQQDSAAARARRVAERVAAGRRRIGSTA